MSRGSKSKTESMRSSLLSQQENDKLEELLGRRCAVSSERALEGFAHSGIILHIICSDLLSFIMCNFTVNVEGEKRPSQIVSFSQI